MALASTISSARPAVRRRSTPRFLWQFQLTIWVAAVALAAAAVWAVLDVRAGAQAAGGAGAQQVVNTQELRARLSAMDSQVTLDLLGGRAGNEEAQKAFSTDYRRTADLMLAVAAEADGPTRQRLSRVNEQLGEYLQRVARAQLLMRQGADNEALTEFRSASDALHSPILLSLEQISDQHRIQVERGYDAVGTRLMVAFGVLSACVMLLALVLLRAQLFLARHMRRVVNPGLVLATVVAVLFVVWSGRALVEQWQQLQRSQQAFGAVQGLWRSKALAYEMYGQQRLYMLDRERIAQHVQVFDANANRLADRRFDRAILQSVQLGGGIGFGGLLAEAMQHMSLAGDRQAMVSVLGKFFTFRDQDSAVREKVQGSRTGEAVLVPATTAGVDNSAFREFDTALSGVIDAQYQRMTAVFSFTSRTFDILVILAPVAGVLIALLAWLGLRPRIGEYS